MKTMDQHSDGTVSITVNGEHKRVAAGLTIAALATELGLVPEKVAVERNAVVVPRSTLASVMVEDGDDLEIVHFVGGGDHAAAVDIDTWTVAGKTFRSRLIVGTGKYRDFAQNAAALEASGAEIVTVAVRRVNISDRNAPMLTDFIDPKRFTYLPNTAGCFSADDAIRTLRLAREVGGWDLVKLEVLGEARTLYPNMRETLTATEILVREGFKPMVYCTDDPIGAKQLEEAGAVAIMPLGAPIGSGLGIQNRVTIRLIVEGCRCAGAGRRRGRHRQRRGRGDGTGLRRRADEHRDCRGKGPDHDGVGDAVGGRGGAACLSRGSYGAASLRRSVEPSCGADLTPLREPGSMSKVYRFGFKRLPTPAVANN